MKSLYKSLHSKMEIYVRQPFTIMPDATIAIFGTKTRVATLHKKDGSKFGITPTSMDFFVQEGYVQFIEQDILDVSSLKNRFDAFGIKYRDS